MYIKSTSIIAFEGVICCQCSDSIEYCKSEDKGEYFFYVGTWKYRFSIRTWQGKLEYISIYLQ